MIRQLSTPSFLFRLLLCLTLCLTTIACKSGPRTDESAIRQRKFQTKSILVLPPINESADIEASDAFLSTITTPLAERGYYVFPIAVVDQMMKENGLPTPGDMHQAPPNKLHEVFGADAVLYIVIREWKTQYVVINTSNQVRIEYLLKDLKTGTTLWQKEELAVQNSGGGSLVGMTVNAAVSAVESAMVDKERKLAITANTQAIHSRKGLIPGHYLVKHLAKE